jgi:hypothetical protein
VREDAPPFTFARLSAFARATVDARASPDARAEVVLRLARKLRVVVLYQ